MAAHKKADFLTVVSIFLAVLVPVLQANGVDLNWWVSAGIYLALVIGFVLSLRLAMPEKSRKRMLWSCAVSVVLVAIGGYATKKQYARDHEEDLNAVRVISVEALPSAVGSPFVFRVQIENLREDNLRATMMCVVAKPSIPIKPLGSMDPNTDTSKERALEDRLFDNLDREENNSDHVSSHEQDLTAKGVVNAYCHSSWLATDTELQDLNHGNFSLYIAGRVVAPGRIKSNQIDVDFCRYGSDKFGLANCFSYNVSHLHQR